MKISWEADAAATEFIQELLAASVTQVSFKRVVVEDDKEVEIEEQLHVIKLKSTLQSDERVTSSIMVVPPHTRGAWKAVRDAFEYGVSDQRFLVVGSPGIGKSRTVNYMILEIINERRKDTRLPLPIIIFEHRKDSKVWRFTPKDASNHECVYEASSVTLGHFMAGDELALDNPDNVYIVDSAKAENSKEPAHLRAKTIFNCSPDAGHFSEWIKHTQRGGTVYVPMWPHEAIEAAQLYMFPETDLVTLKQQMEVVGPFPRRLTPKAFTTYKTKIDSAMQQNVVEISNILLNGAGKLEAEQDNLRRNHSAPCLASMLCQDLATQNAGSALYRTTHDLRLVWRCSRASTT